MYLQCNLTCATVSPACLLFLLKVKENPIPSDSLLTIDLKSGPTVTLGTHVITLDKMFEGE